MWCSNSRLLLKPNKGLYKVQIKSYMAWQAGRQFPQFTAVVNGHHERSPNNTKMLKSGQAATRTHVSIGPYLKNRVFKGLDRTNQLKCISERKSVNIVRNYVSSCSYTLKD